MRSVQMDLDGFTPRLFCWTSITCIAPSSSSDQAVICLTHCPHLHLLNTILSERIAGRDAFLMEPLQQRQDNSFTDGHRTGNPFQTCTRNSRFSSKRSSIVVSTNA